MKEEMKLEDLCKEDLIEIIHHLERTRDNLKQDKEELIKWLEEKISCCDVKFSFTDDYKERAYKEVLNKLKGE